LDNGWKIDNIEDDKYIFSKKRAQKIYCDFFALNTTNIIRLPYIRYWDKSFVLQTLLPATKKGDESEITINVPKGIIPVTYPMFKSKNDLLDNNREELIIPYKYINYLPDNASVLNFKIQILGPLFRNAFGNKIIFTMVWEPIKWVLLTLCLYFQNS